MQTPAPFDYERATSLDGAIASLKEHANARIIAGRVIGLPSCSQVPSARMAIRLSPVSAGVQRSTGGSRLASTASASSASDRAAIWGGGS